MKCLMTAAASVVIFCALSGGAPARALPLVANDTCAAPVMVEPGHTYAGSNLGALDDYRAMDGQGNGPDVVFVFELDARARVTIDPDATDYFVDAYVRTACEDAGSEVAFADWLGGQGTGPVESVLPQDSTRPPLRANLDAGTYFLILDTQGSAGFPYKVGDYAMRFDVEPVRALDACDSPGVVGPEGFVDGSTSDAVDDTTSPGVPAGGRDVVYRLSLTGTTDVRLSTAGSSFDTVVYIRSVCTDPSTVIAMNDDADGDRWHSALDVELPEGDYFVFVDGWDRSAAGPYTLTLEFA